MHLINTLSPAGAETVVRDIVLHSDEDINSTVGFLWGSDALADDIEAGGGNVVGFDAGFRYNPYLIYKIASYVKDNNIDVIHAHLPVSIFLGRIAGALAGVKVISTHHNVPDNYQLPSRTLEFITRPLDDKTITISNGVLDAWGDPDWQIIFNGIDVEDFHQQVKEANSSQIRETAGHPDLLLLNVGRYVPEKRQSDLIKMMAKITEADVDAHLFIVGFGQLESELQDKVDRFGVSNSVTITGKVPSVIPYYAAADIFVSSLNYQGMGLVHFEAMASELPVVSTDIPDMRDVVDDGVSGFLSPPNDPEGLAQSIFDLQDKKLRKQMGEAGYNLAKNKFSSSRTAKEYTEIYRKVVSD